MKKPLVAIITINYNQTQETEQCIFSLKKLNYSNYKIFLVDNGSDLKNYSDLKQKFADSIDIIRIEQNKGYVGGVNEGLRFTNKFSPKYFLILNNDTKIDQSALTELVNTSEKYSDNCIVSGKVYKFDNPNTLQYIGQKCSNKNRFSYTSIANNTPDEGQFDHELEMDMLDDIFWLLPKKVFDKVGLYSYFFFLYGEQNDYAFRAVNQGVKLIYTPNAKLWHKGGITTAGGNKQSPKIVYWQQKATLKLTFLYLKKLHFIIYYLNYFIKLIILYPIKSIFNNKVIYKKNVHKAYYLAFVDFTKWFCNKKADDGYNPF